MAAQRRLRRRSNGNGDGGAAMEVAVVVAAQQWGRSNGGGGAAMVVDRSHRRAPVKNYKRYGTKYVSYDAQLCPVIAKGLRAPNAQLTHQIVNRHHEEL